MWGGHSCPPQLTFILLWSLILELVIQSERARFALRIALRSRRIPIPGKRLRPTEEPYDKLWVTKITFAFS